MPEIERKFVVAEPPPRLEEERGVDLRQGYLGVAPVEVRVRRGSDGSFELTIKGGSGLERAEVNVPLNEEQFDELWGLVRAKLEKTRHTVYDGPRPITIDVYRNHLAGLVIAEVEFGSRQDALRFDPPPWLGPEVTHDPRFRNAALAQADEMPTP